MSYTVAIQGKKPIDGSIPLKTLAETSADFHKPESSKKAEGYISVDGKTCVGVAFVAKGKEEIVTIEKKLRDSEELRDRKVMVRSVDLGPHKVCVVNLLIPQSEIFFLSRVFDGVKSDVWLLENTGWWPEYEGDVTITPPGIAVPKDKSPLVIFRVGTVTLYFDETKKDSQRTQEIYGEDERGYLFRQKYPNYHVSQVGDLLFAREIENHGYEAGLRRLTTNEGTGLSHGYTVAYFDELNNALTCAHLMHENTKGRWEKLETVDIKGNVLVVAGRTTTEYFLQHWPYEVNEVSQNVEGAKFAILERQKAGIERVR